MSGGHLLRKVAAVDNKSGGVDTNKKSVGKATGNMETCEGERTVKEPHMAGRCVSDDVRGRCSPCSELPYFFCFFSCSFASMCLLSVQMRRQGQKTE